MSRALPSWPAMMRKVTAAAYLDMPLAKFERAVVAGEVPAPVLWMGEERWSRIKIDDRLERIAGTRRDNRARAKLYARP